MCVRQTLLSINFWGVCISVESLRLAVGFGPTGEKSLFLLSVFSQRYSCQHDIDLLEGWRFILAGLDLESIQWQFTVYLDCLFVC